MPTRATRGRISHRYGAWKGGEVSLHTKLFHSLTVATGLRAGMAGGLRPGCSRRRWTLAADALVERVLAQPSLTVTRGGVAGTVVGRSAQGGLRVSGGTNGFAERTVSRIDLGWALAAQDDVARKGGVLDEARVNRLRYLDGTEKAATRWIDTGWALAVLAWASVTPGE